MRWQAVGQGSGNKYSTDSIDCDIDTTVKDYDKFGVHFASEIHLQISRLPSQAEKKPWQILLQQNSNKSLTFAACMTEHT